MGKPNSNNILMAWQLDRLRYALKDRELADAAGELVDEVANESRGAQAKVEAFIKDQALTTMRRFVNGTAKVASMRALIELERALRLAPAEAEADAVTEPEADAEPESQTEPEADASVTGEYRTGWAS